MEVASSAVEARSSSVWAASACENIATLCSVTGVVVGPREIVVVFDEASHSTVLSALGSIEVVCAGVAWPYFHMGHCPPTVVFQIDNSNDWTTNYLQGTASLKWFSIDCSSITVLDNNMSALSPNLWCIRCKNLLRINGSRTECEQMLMDDILVLLVIQDVCEFTCTLPCNGGSSLIHYQQELNVEEFLSRRLLQILKRCSFAYQEHKGNAECRMSGHCSAAPRVELASSTWLSKHVLDYLEGVKQEVQDCGVETTLRASPGSQSFDCAASERNLHSEIEIDASDVKTEVPEVPPNADLLSAFSGSELPAAISLSVEEEIEDTHLSIDYHSPVVPESDLDDHLKEKELWKQEVEHVPLQFSKGRRFMLLCPECDKTFKGGVIRLPSLYEHVKSCHPLQSVEVNKFLEGKYSAQNLCRLSQRRCC